MSFLLLDGHHPLGVFSGGSLMVGAAARTDLVDSTRTDELARAQYASLQRLMTLPDTVAVWPTHGAGSFCSGPTDAERTSTIGRERTSNPLLEIAGEDAFVERLLASFGSYPPYFDRLGAVNRRGPEVLTVPPRLSPIAVDRVLRLRDDGAVVVDVRPFTRYAEAHIHGSLSIELRDAFATWLGWLVPFEAPVVIVRDPDQDPDDIAGLAVKVGYTIVGELDGGLPAWRAAGHLVSSTELVSPEDIDGQALLDIRQRIEYATGHVPGAHNIELGGLVHRVDEVAAGTVVMCGHGERAMSAASVFESAGRGSVAVLLGGPEDWAGAHRRDLETSR